MLPFLPITFPDFEAGQRMRKMGTPGSIWAEIYVKKNALSSATCPSHCDLKNFSETASWKV